MNPLEALHPIIVTQVRHPESPTSKQRARARGEATRQVLSCTQCELYKSQPDTPTPFNGPTSARFVVVGEAPGPKEAALGKPFVGPSGKLLRALMQDVEIDPEDDVVWMNSVSCFPSAGNEGVVVRSPTDTEIKACHSNASAQIASAYTTYVLLVGAKAFNIFRSDLQITSHHGRVFVMYDSYVVMGIIHPAAALRGQSGFKSLIREDLAKWRDIVYGGDNPLGFLGHECVKCPSEAVMWDRDGVPWCMKHYEKWKNQWEKERMRWMDPPAIQLTF